MVAKILCLLMMVMQKKYFNEFIYKKNNILHGQNVN